MSTLNSLDLFDLLSWAIGLFRFTRKLIFFWAHFLLFLFSHFSFEMKAKTSIQSACSETIHNKGQWTGMSMPWYDKCCLIEENNNLLRKKKVKLQMKGEGLFTYIFSLFAVTFNLLASFEDRMSDWIHSQGFKKYWIKFWSEGTYWWEIHIPSFAQTCRWGNESS